MSVRVFGVTGTNGKTTSAYMLKAILEEAGKSCAIIGTVKHEIGKRSFEVLNTTPSRELLRLYLEEMKKQQIDCCVMEASSHGLEQGRVDDIEISYAGFTNLTQDHLDYHKDMEHYFAAKKKLFYMAKKGACVNIDDDYGKRLFEILKSDKEKNVIHSDFRLCGFSLKDKNADFYGNVLKNDIDGIEMELYLDGVFSEKVNIHIPSITAAYNGLLAAGMASLYFRDIRIFDFEKLIADALKNMKGVDGRFERVENDKGYNIVVDFAHTPDALENLLKNANVSEGGHLICVFGCGGNRDKAKRSIMGRIAGENCGFCIITSDNPRFEDPYKIMEDIEKGIAEVSCDYIMEEDREKAILKALEIYKKGDLIIIAGKGHEKYQIVNGEKLPFDDVEVAKKLIQMKEQ